MSDQDDYNRWAASITTPRPSSGLGQSVAWLVAVVDIYAGWHLFLFYQRFYKNPRMFGRGEREFVTPIVIVVAIVMVLVLWRMRRVLLEGALDAAALALRVSRRAGREVRRRADQ